MKAKRAAAARTRSELRLERRQAALHQHQLRGLARARHPRVTILCRLRRPRLLLLL